MALSSSTFSSAGGAVSDLFGGFGALAQGDLKAKGLQIQAQGLRLKAQGDLAEASNYDLASGLAEKNKQFTETSTAVQQVQLQRQNSMQFGGQQAAIAGAGFAASGSGIDIMVDSARQGALATAVLGQQGLITEAGYEEQSQSFQTMASTARATAAGEQQIANETDQLAQETKDAAKTSAIGDFLGGAIKAVGAVASVALAPATGGLSLAALPSLFTGGS